MNIDFLDLSFKMDSNLVMQYTEAQGLTLEKHSFHMKFYRQILRFTNFMQNEPKVVFIIWQISYLSY